MSKIYEHEELVCEQGVHTYRINVKADKISNMVMNELAKVASTAKIDGFRKGKAPFEIVTNRYFASALDKVVSDVVNATSQDLLETFPRDRIVAPKSKVISYPYSEGNLSDLAYELSFELLGDIPLIECTGITLTSKEAGVQHEDAKIELANMMTNASHFVDTSDKSADTGDKVSIKYAGKILGKPFRGSSGTVEFTIGSNTVPELLEKAVIGMKELEKKESVSVAFPQDYPNALLAGRTIGMDVELLKVMTPKSFSSEEEFAKARGFETYEKLLEHSIESMKNQSQQITDLLLKKELLDFLDKEYAFQIPKSLLDDEEKVIRTAMESAPHDKEDENQVRANALRRVKLGMLLMKFGETHGIKVDNIDLLQQLQSEFGHNRELFSNAVATMRHNRDFARAVHGRALENKVVREIISKAALEKHPLTFEELKNGFENA